MTPLPPSPEFVSLQRALIGRFSLIRELGRGGMGIVFLARDVALDRNVAIKLLPPHFASIASHRQRFLREARLAARLSHPHIVPIHLVDEVDHLVFFVMGYVEGETLGERIRRRGPLPPGEVARVVQQVAWALAHAHARGIVHRDVKPDNILIESATGRAVVSDFGIAGVVDSCTPSDGVAVGTPLYLSPEQAGGAPGDARSDLYALGVTAWYALTGKHPHEAISLPALLVERATRPTPTVLRLRADVPSALASAIDRALALHPADRWPDGESLALALEHAHARPEAPPPRVRSFVRTTMPLGTELAAASTAGISALGMMVALSRGGLFDAIYAQAIAIPIIGLAASYGVIRVAQSALALLDVVREGHDHAVVARALRDEEHELSLEADGRATTQRRRDAIWYGSLGVAKSTAMLWVASASLPDWVTVPAAIGAVVLPTITVLKVWQLLRPGPGRWPRLMRGRLGRGIMSLMRRLSAGTPVERVSAYAPTATLLGGAIEELFNALPDSTRRQLADLPTLARDLQREALSGAEREDPSSRARATNIATALETIRLELLALRAGLREVPEVTRYLEEARRLGERVDAHVGLPMSPSTPST